MYKYTLVKKSWKGPLTLGFCLGNKNSETQVKKKVIRKPHGNQASKWSFGDKNVASTYCFLRTEANTFHT